MLTCWLLSDSGLGPKPQWDFVPHVSYGTGVCLMHAWLGFRSLKGSGIFQLMLLGYLANLENQKGSQGAYLTIVPVLLKYTFYFSQLRLVLFSKYTFYMLFLSSTPGISFCLHYFYLAPGTPQDQSQFIFPHETFLSCSLAWSTLSLNYLIST